MRLERRHALLLLAIAAWNVVTFGNFAMNLYAAFDSGEQRAAGYWIAHGVLIVVNVAIAAALASLGWRALQALKVAESPEALDTREASER